MFHRSDRIPEASKEPVSSCSGQHDLVKSQGPSMAAVPNARHRDHQIHDIPADQTSAAERFVKTPSWCPFRLLKEHI